MKEPHVILRSTISAARDVFRSSPLAPASESTMAEVIVEVEDLDRGRVPEITRNAEVFAVAPVIPLRLIDPVPAQIEDPLVVDGTAWGVKAVAADTCPFSGSGIVVAVLDTGIDASHPAFKNVKILQQDFCGEGNGDAHGHGTHCAGTIFGRNSEGIRIGVAPGIERALIGKVLGKGGGSSAQLVRGIQWAVDNGANVISMSLGIDFPGLVERFIAQGLPVSLATSRALEGYRANVLLFERLASLVRAQGNLSGTAIIIAAAGNESQREINPDFRIAVSPPAVSEGIISVGALSRDRQGLNVAWFSNTGVNLAGPGVGITSAKAGGGLTIMNGTSMATPHVAGVAALWAEKIKSTGVLNAFQLIGRLSGSATTQGFKTGFDPYDVGAGLVQAPRE